MATDDLRLAEGGSTGMLNQIILWFFLVLLIVFLWLFVDILRDLNSNSKLLFYLFFTLTSSQIYFGMMWPDLKEKKR